MALKTATARALLACRLAALVAALTGCSEIKFGRQEQKADPNAYPTNYKTDLLAYVRTNPVDMLNARDIYVSAPALKQFGSDSRYAVCLRADGQDWHKEKMVIFFSGRSINSSTRQANSAALPRINRSPNFWRRLAHPAGRTRNISRRHDMRALRVDLLDLAGQEARGEHPTHRGSMYTVVGMITPLPGDTAPRYGAADQSFFGFM